MEWLHGQQPQEFKPEMLKEPSVVEFIDATTKILNDAVDEGLKVVPLDEVSVQRLKESNFVFSGYKTFHELNEAFPSLLNKDGNIKPFDMFLDDVQRINTDYNKYYLKAEYNFAVQSSLSAAQWKNFLPGDQFNLQYRTVGDERVRISHRMLDRITLPMTSKFWDWYFPPNGWGCRCDVVQVRAKKYPATNEQEAMNAGSQATSGKHQEMFRFNPGKQMATFPAYNPYSAKACADCNYKRTKNPKNEQCAACKVIQEMKEDRQSLKMQRKELQDWARDNLVGKTVAVQGVQNPVEFTMTGIKETLNQPHRQMSAKNKALTDIISLLKDGEHVMEKLDDKGNATVFKYHYIKIRIDGEDSYAVIRDLVNGKSQFYTIVERLKKRE